MDEFADTEWKIKSLSVIKLCINNKLIIINNNMHKEFSLKLYYYSFYFNFLRLWINQLKQILNKDG